MIVELISNRGKHLGTYYFPEKDTKKINRIVAKLFKERNSK